MIEGQEEIAAPESADDQEQPCCPHVFAQPWGLAINARAVTVVPRICCHHGELSVLYNGLVEAGHGPFVGFEVPVAAAALALPSNGAGLIR